MLTSKIYEKCCGFDFHVHGNTLFGSLKVTFTWKVYTKKMIGN